MTVSSGSLLRAMRVPSRSENSRSHAVQRSRSMCLCVPVHDRCAMLPSPGRLNCAHCGFGHENRVYLSWTGVVSVIVVLLCAGLDQKILIRRQFFHVTNLQDYLKFREWEIDGANERIRLKMPQNHEEGKGANSVEGVPLSHLAAYHLCAISSGLV